MVKKIKEIFKGTTLILIIINLVIFAMPSKIYAANTCLLYTSDAADD